jgi:hypothetical protein
LNGWHEKPDVNKIGGRFRAQIQRARFAVNVNRRIIFFADACHFPLGVVFAPLRFGSNYSFFASLAAFATRSNAFLRVLRVLRDPS